MKRTRSRSDATQEGGTQLAHQKNVMSTGLHRRVCCAELRPLREAGDTTAVSHGEERIRTLECARQESQLERLSSVDVVDK